MEKHDVFLRRHQHSQNLFTLELTWFMVSPVTPRGSESCGDAGMKAAEQTCDRVLNPWLLGLADEGSEPISQAEEAWRG